MDYGHQITDRKLSEADKALQRVYKQAQKELEKKLKDFTRKSEARDKVMRQKVTDGLISKQDYKDWLAGQVFVRERWERKVSQVCMVMNDHNQQAVKLVNEGRLDVFAENYNYMSFQAEKKIAVSFDLYNVQAVARLLLDDPQLLPEWKIDEEKDYVWNYQKVKNIVTQGIIQGEGIPQITKRLCEDLSTQDYNRMRSLAVTAMTGAENAGRQLQMESAAKLGIDVWKRWEATHDSKTRDLHRARDGEEVPYNEEFSGGLEYPGDMSGSPEDIYNCRCAMVSFYPEYENKEEAAQRYKEMEIDGQSYEEWKEGKKKAQKEQDVDLKSEQTYEHIWFDLVQEQSWKEFREGLREDQERAILALLENNPKGYSPDVYWNAMRDGLVVDEKMNRLLLGLEDGSLSAKDIQSIIANAGEKLGIGIDREIGVNTAGKGIPSNRYIDAINERFRYATDTARAVYQKYIPEGGAVFDGASAISQFEEDKAGDRKIRMNYKNDENNVFGAGKTWYHEHGHYVDYKLGWASKSDIFLNKIKDDISNFEREYGRKNNITDIGTVRMEIGKHFGKGTHGIQDVYGAVVAKGYYPLAITGHYPEYWGKRDEFAVSQEAFAHMFEAMFDTNAGKQMERYLPSSYEYFIKIMEGAAQ